MATNGPGSGSAHSSHHHSRAASGTSTPLLRGGAERPDGHRESHVPSSSNDGAGQGSAEFADSAHASARDESATEEDAWRPYAPDGVSSPANDDDDDDDDDDDRPSSPANFIQAAPHLRTRLLTYKSWDQASGCGSPHCRHGTFSPRPPTGGSARDYGSIQSPIPGDGCDEGEYFENSAEYVGGGSVRSRKPLGEAVADLLLRGGKSKKSSTTAHLAREHGVKNTRMMYLTYYFPFLNWTRQYKWSYLRGDLIAATTVASFYIPMSLSLAANLGHIPPINGMYSFVFNPLIYALLGTCPRMIVGPEAAGSLLTGTVVKENINRGHSGEDEELMHAKIAGVVTSTAGAFIFMAGLTRLGFLDNVLSRPFLRGFISAIGVVILFDQLIPELGLQKLALQVGGVSHGSVISKIQFTLTHLGDAHRLTSAVSLGAFAIILACRTAKLRLQSRYPSVIYVPDRFLIVVLSAVLTWRFGWDEKGLDVLGDIRTGGRLFQVHSPFHTDHFRHLSDAMSTSFIIALLGFFESSVAAKSLGTSDGNPDGLHNVPMSTNRELVALGVANIVGGTFMALPAFGGYGRSKVNASTGGMTPMSSIFLSLITIICCVGLLPYFYYLPKGVLCAMISVVAVTLVEEAPHDIRFFWRISGWSELILMAIIFFTTIFWDLKTGVAVGIGLSILRVLRHSTRPRIQILGRVPGTTDQFQNAEASADADVEFIEGFLIVKIPEPLTFANTGDLRARLRRLEDHGTSAAHPALPRVRRAEHNKNLIFDVHGVTSLDGAGAQVLSEIVAAYRQRGVRVFFCRVPAARSPVWRLFETSGIVELCGGRRHFVHSVHEAVRMTELESMTEEFAS